MFAYYYSESLTLAPEIGIALLGGILPACIWLFFWLTEDSAHPEPRMRLVKTFAAGAAATIASLVLEYVASFVISWVTGRPASLTPDASGMISLGWVSIFVLVIWAAIEEVTKFIAARNVALISPDDDEPIDPLIYMITAALGFAAMENTLFIISSALQGGITTGIESADLRFIGASLVHTIASGTLGAFMSFSFYKSHRSRILYLVMGLVSATALHALFNLAIIKADRNIIGPFGLVWIAVIFLIYMFERVKALHKS